MISDIVTTGELPQSVVESMAQYVGCVAGASLQSDYEKMMISAGFGRVEIAESRVVDRESWDPEKQARAGVDVLSVTFVAYK